MSATLPPTADFDRSSDFGEFWRHAEAAPPVASVMPEPEAEVPVRQPLSPEQQARRLRLRRLVGSVVLGLLAFTALAACVHVVKGRSAESSEPALAARPAAAATSKSEPAQPPSSAPVAVAAPVTLPALSDLDQALALAQAPVATVANLESWSQLVARLEPADQRRVEQQLTLQIKKGSRAVREAARLELALLWRATERRAKAQKALVALARSAKDPSVKRQAKASLSSV